MKKPVLLAVICSFLVAFLVAATPPLFGQGNINIGGVDYGDWVNLEDFGTKEPYFGPDRDISQVVDDDIIFNNATGANNAATLVLGADGNRYSSRLNGDIVLESTGILDLGYSHSNYSFLHSWGAIRGSGDLIITPHGNGGLELVGDLSNYSGDFHLMNDSRLFIGSPTLHSGDIYLSDNSLLTIGSIDNNSGTPRTYFGIIHSVDNQSGCLWLSDVGTLILENAGSEFTGYIDLWSGNTLQVKQDYFGGTMSCGGIFDMGSTTQSYRSFGANGTVLMDGGHLTIGYGYFVGSIDGTGTFVKTGVEDFDLSEGTSNFTGHVDVQEGTLYAPSNFGTSLTVDSGGWIDITDTTQNYQSLHGNGGIGGGGCDSSFSLTIGSGVFSGVISGGNVTKTGAGVFTLTNEGNVWGMGSNGAYVDSFHVSQGELVMAGSASLMAWGDGFDPGMTVASGATLRLSPNASGAPMISETLIDMQGKLIIEMRDYQKIATFNNAIPMMNPNNLVFEGISYLRPDQIRTVEFTDMVDSNYQTVLDTWNSCFDKPLVNVNVTNIGGWDYDMNINAVSLVDFAKQSGGYTQNQLSQFESLEQERLDPGISDSRRNWFEALYNASNPYIDWPPVDFITDPTNEIGDAVVGFNLGSAGLFSDIAFSSTNLWADMNSQNNRNTGQGNTNYLGQAKNKKTAIYYARPYYKSVQTDTRNIGPGYGIARTGVVGGVTFDADPTVSYGLIFGYSNPKLYQSDRNVEMDDLMFGGMLVKSFSDTVDLGVLMTGGWQNGNSRRDVWSNSHLHRYSGDFDGRTLNGSVELGKKYFRYCKHLIIKPTVGLDYEGTWISGFAEQFNGASPEFGTLADNRFARRYYNNCHYNRVLFKTGIAGSFGGDTGRIAGKILYGSQLGGKDYATVDAILMDGTFDGELRQYMSLPIGRDFVRFEGGIHRYINTKKTALLYSSYNTTLYKHTTEQTVLLGMQWMR